MQALYIRLSRLTTTLLLRVSRPRDRGSPPRYCRIRLKYTAAPTWNPEAGAPKPDARPLRGEPTPRTRRYGPSIGGTVARYRMA